MFTSNRKRFKKREKRLAAVAETGSVQQIVTGRIVYSTSEKEGIESFRVGSVGLITVYHYEHKNSVSKGKSPKHVRRDKYRFGPVKKLISSQYSH